MVPDPTGGRNPAMRNAASRGTPETRRGRRQPPTAPKGLDELWWPSRSVHDLAVQGQVQALDLGLLVHAQADHEIDDLEQHEGRDP